MSEEQIKYLEGRVEALISLNDALVNGLDIRSQINRDLKKKLEEKSNFELFFDWVEVNHKKDFKRNMKLFQEWLWKQNSELS